MAGAWTENGPVALPPRSIAYGAGAMVIVLAALGLGFGFRAAQREGPTPVLGGGAAADAGDTLTARPIVEPAPAPKAADDTDDQTASDDASAAQRAKAEAIASQTAEAQAVQSKPSKSQGDIDTILTSPSEKPPPPPVKSAADEAPPGQPVKTDVPF